MAVPLGQVSIAGSAIAALQKEFSSSVATRKIIKPVKSPSPSPSRRVAEAGVTAEPVRPPFKDFSEKHPSHLQKGVVCSGGMERIYEDWGNQVRGLA